MRGHTEQQPHLVARAAAKFDQGAIFREEACDICRMFLEDPQLCTRRIIFRQRRDPLEQPRSQLVVEILRWQPLARSAQAPEDVVCEAARLLRDGRLLCYPCRRAHGMTSRKLPPYLSARTKRSAQSQAQRSAR